MGFISDGPLRYAPALLKKIGLGGKGLPGTNTLAYYNVLNITDVICFLTLAPDVSESNLGLQTLFSIFKGFWSIIRRLIKWTD